MLFGGWVMLLPAVHIDREPLLNMLLAAAETYNRECLGYIFGREPTKKRPFYHITNVIAIQGVRRRTNAEIEQSQRSSTRLNRYIKASKGLYPILGDFHSHPASGRYKRLVAMSDTDVDSMRKDKDVKIAVIVDVATRGRARTQWEIPVVGRHAGILRGTLGDFAFKVCVYTLVPGVELPTVERLTIVSPDAVKALNRVNL